MRRERTYLLLLLTFVVGGFTLGHFRSHDEFVRLRLSDELPAAADRSAVDRLWRDAQLELRSSSDGKGTELLRLVRASKRGPDDLTLALDRADSTVRAFDAAGRLRWQTPVAMDAESGSRFTPVDLAVAASGEIWIADGSAPRLRIYAPGGGKLRTVALQSIPERLALAPDGGFTILTLTAGSHLLESYGPDGGLRRHFGRLLAGDFQEPLLLAGSLAGDGDGGTVLAPFYLGILAAFDRDGGVRFVVETVGGKGGGLPPVLAAGNSRRLEPGTPLRSLAVDVDGGRIYVLSERETMSSRSRIVDVYAVADGAYLRSFRLPYGPRDLLVEGDDLYVIHKDRIQRWTAGAGLGG